MGVETVDSWRMASARATRDPGKRLEHQTSSKEQQLGLRWLGRTSPGREIVTTSVSGSRKQPTIEKGVSLHPVYQVKEPKSSVKPTGHSSVRTKRQHRGPEVQSQILASPRGENESLLHDDFKKEFLESLVKKAKQRSRFSPSSETIIKAIEAKANVDRSIVPVPQRNTVASSPIVREEHLGQKATSNTISPRSTLEITSQEIKGRTSPTNDKFCDTVCISKPGKSNKNQCDEQSWSIIKVVEEEKKSLIATGVFGAQTNKAVESSCEEELDGGLGEEVSPSADSSTNHNLLYEQKIYQNCGKIDVRQQLFVHPDEAHNLRQTIAETMENGESDVHILDQCNMLVNQAHQVRSETAYGTPSLSPSGRRLWSLESGKDSLNILRKKLDGKRSSDDTRSKTRKDNASGFSVSENQKQVKGTEVPQLSPESNGAFLPKNENMVRSLKLAAAIDQTHFIRALQIAGAVQTSSPSRVDCDRDSQFSPLAKLSSPKDKRNTNNLQEVKCKFSRQADGREIKSGATSAIPLVPKHSGGAVSVRRPPSNGSTSSKCPLNVIENGRVRMEGSPILRTGDASSPRESSHRSSTASDDSDTCSGASNSMLQILMRKVSIRSSLTSQSDESNASFPCGPASPASLSTPTPRASSDLDHWLRSSNVVRCLTDNNKHHLDSPPSSSPRIPYSSHSGSSSRTTSCEPRLTEDLPALLRDNKRSRTKIGLTDHHLEQPKVSAADDVASADFGNVVLNVPSETITTDAESQSHDAASPPVRDSQTCETALEPCHKFAKPERIFSTDSIGENPRENPRSPGSDDSGSEASCTDHSSPVSVLSFKNGRTPLQEDNRLTPLEHKLQELHERIHKSKRDVCNQKMANLEKIKTARRELMLRGSELIDPTIKEISVNEDVSIPSQVPTVKSPKHVVEMQVKGMASFANRSPVLRRENVNNVISGSEQLVSSSSLENFDLGNVRSWTEELKWDLVYVRDLLLVSNFGQDASKGTKWHSVTMPMNPGLFENLEEYYKRGKKFSGSQVLNRLALSQDDHVKLRDRIRAVHLNPPTAHQGFVDAMNRCQLFDAVNETLAKRLIPYIAVPRPWMTSWAKPVVRPRSTQSGLLLEICADIFDQFGNNGSMAMDKIKLHQSLEDLVRSDLSKRSHLFPCRELERAAERIGLELDRGIFEELLEETIVHLAQPRFLIVSRGVSGASANLEERE